jgi:hypothetical protein
MKKILLCVAIIILAFAVMVAYSAGYYGTDSSTSLTASADITSGNATLNNITAITGNITGTLTANVANITTLYASAAGLTGLRTDTANVSTIPFIDQYGNVTSLGLMNGLSLSGGNLTITAANITGFGNAAYLNNGTGANNLVQLDSSGKLPALNGSTLTVAQLASFSFVDTDTAVTVSASKKGYVVPSAYNGANVSTMTCSVYDLNGANANSTIINLTKSRAGSLTNVFDNGVNIANTDYTATSTGINATNAALLTGDFLFANVEAIADPAPKGLSCTFTFSK